ncbi:leucine-rich repeat domain-containing protein [Emticicia sp. 21SJ11W-3]|uniref:leucine-rich repeat domain-containing protein n=1 Tax=Emticicia sp. 21SJ11W-3 TaxID=2916755 RepID=UPI00209E0989|nr:leucine-rich repeat domain-containing protein [Emticicia sp. 21SJ11W-3]UTA69064.1 leucine-rich repeat domain-containing protein [Emticicia sp. 21SJ11W-3]
MSELALQLIEENKRTKEPFLDLGNCGLRGELPKELSDCIWLERLNLGDYYYDFIKNQSVKSKNPKATNKFSGRNFDILQNLTQLHSLDLSSNQIQDISFLQNLSQLHSLDLSSNQIQDISFLQNLSQLQSLDLSSNQIQDISFLQNLSQLQSLDLSSNQIQDYSFLQNLSQLQSLDLSYNQIQDISFLQNLSQLQSLDLRYNQIQDISFLQNLSQLQSLDLRYNQIQDISFLQNLSQLQSLDLRSNQIQDYSFLQNLSQLQSLDLRSNQIQDISFLQNLSQLQSLYLSSNQIQDIRYLQNLSQLQSLDLRYNQIQDISFLQNLSQLQSLDLRYNQIQDIRYLQNLSQLQSLNLRYNQIQDISFLQNLSQLQSLDLRLNQIQDISFLQNLSQLQSLYLSSNQIQDISFLQNLSQLQSLYLSSNQIQDIRYLQNLSQLQSLDLSDNQIQDSSFLQNLSQLQSLYLSSNQIQDISFLQNLSQLQSLYLRYNQIQDIRYLQNLSQLQSLDLRYNQIQDISFLQNLSQLQSLYLSSNQIQDISFLQNLSQLQSLDLRQNQIQDISQLKYIINLQYLFEIYFSDNPIHLPAELDLDSVNDLKSFFRDLDNGSTNKRFVKLLFLGDGCVGKTTLYKHLKLGSPPPQIDTQERTHGIVLDTWDKEFKDLKINVWDFGGQEIFHGTHRLFLGLRAIYILVWTKQSNKKCSQEEQHPLKYWLDFIADYGKESTVLLVENTIDDEFDSQQFPDDKVLEDLVKEFKSRKIELIPTNYRINCQQNTKDVNRFKRVLQGEIENILDSYPIEEFPANRLAVIETLEDFKKTNRTLPMTDYINLCKENNIYNPNALLSFLNRLGVISYFKNLFSETIILQTEWVLDAMYEALRLTNNPLKIKKGKLNDDDFNKIWQNYNESEKSVFKNYMLQSELLAEPISKNRAKPLQRNYQYLMPNLFPNCPDHLKFEWDDKQSYWVIKFRFMYPAIMQRLEVKILNYCHYEEEESLFKDYLAFTGKQKERCHIEVFEEIKEMRIWTNTTNYYIEIINFINEIYPLERLQVFERIKNKEDRRIEFVRNEEKEKYQLKEEKPLTEITMKVKDPIKVFVTYCWTDKNEKNDEVHQTKVHQLVNSLRNNGFDATFDKAINDTSTANDFMRMMVENMHKNENIIVVLSEGYAIKANSFKGGVGDEYQLLIKDINKNPNKYILVSFNRRSDEIYPLALMGRDTVDLSNLDEEEVKRLIRKLDGTASVHLAPIGKKVDSDKPKDVGKLF